MESLSKDVHNDLFQDICQLIDETKNKVASVFNSEMALLFWSIGNRINSDILNYSRAEYDKQIVVTLSRQLCSIYGDTYNEKKLRKMMQFSMVFVTVNYKESRNVKKILYNIIKYFTLCSICKFI